ncbi:hypothetical protein DBV05_g10242 [Lasiodiplodia theobromae]|uniref:RutC family protein n=1 Tax=Lasiodiplodia theobromae TaxID=45133 RepID=A0A5N5D0A5_9PEZI|nr:hypothetical protein DBV05_g10242 [Lasiodiplodia theobromae]
MALPVVTTINRTDQSHASRAYSGLSIVSVPPNNPTVRILRTAGQVGTSAVGSSTSIPASFHEQAKNAFANVAACLYLGGAMPRDITKITIYVVNFELWMREVLVDTITNFSTNDDSQKPHKPPSTLLGVTALASEDFLIEVEAEAMIAVSP